jgi:RNA polymerase sigma factor (sigma-70 family)
MMERSAGDAELWRRSRAGDAEAFGALFDRYAKRIYAYCFRRSADWAMAEDLTSVVFLEAWRGRDKVTLADGRIEPWLYGIATNVLRNQRRALRRYRRALGRMPALEPERDFADDVIARVDSVGRMREVLLVVGRLPKGEQDALTLCDWQGLSGREAADALKVPEATVRTRLFRARRRLREFSSVGPVQSSHIARRGWSSR